MGRQREEGCRIRAGGGERDKKDKDHKQTLNQQLRMQDDSNRTGGQRKPFSLLNLIFKTITEQLRRWRKEQGLVEIKEGSGEEWTTWRKWKKRVREVEERVTARFNLFSCFRGPH